MSKIIVFAFVILSVSFAEQIVLQNSSNSQSTLNLTALREAELARHNQLRALHGCSPLVINETLNTAAQNYSDYLYTSVGDLVHSANANNGTYGENLYWGWGSLTVDYDTAAASNSWYDENENYNYTTATAINASMMVGHFTAMIWKEVKSVGFGYRKGVENGGEALYVTANYYPTPNVEGEYIANVPKPL